MSKQPPKTAATAVQKEKGFLETVKEKIGSGMGYLDSVLSKGPQMGPTTGRILPSARMIRPDSVKTGQQVEYKPLSIENKVGGPPRVKTDPKTHKPRIY